MVNFTKGVIWTAVGQVSGRGGKALQGMLPWRMVLLVLLAALSLQSISKSESVFIRLLTDIHIPDSTVFLGHFPCYTATDYKCCWLTDEFSSWMHVISNTFYCIHNSQLRQKERPFFLPNTTVKIIPHSGWWCHLPVRLDKGKVHYTCSFNAVNTYNQTI